MNRSQKSFLYAGLATLCWSTVASAFKLTLDTLQNDVFTMVFYSVLFSLIVLFLTVLFQGKGRELLNVSAKGIVSSMFLGLFNPFLYYIILFKSYSLLPGQEAQPLNYTWPIMLTLLSVPLLRQKMKWVHLFGILVSFGGVLIISTRGQIRSLSLTHWPGVLLALSSAVIWAFYWIFNLRDRRGVTAKLFMNFFFGFLYIAVTLCLTQGIVLPVWKGLVGTLWIGFFEMGLTFIFWMKALEYAESTSIVSNVVYLSPFISLIFLKVVVGEQLFFSSILGLLLIVAGILIQISKPKNLYPN